MDAVRQSFTGTEAQVPEIRFEKTGGGLSWGAVYAQFFEETAKLKEKKGNGVSVVRTYYLDGKKVTAGTSLKVGDKLTVRLQVKADRDMDFIQLRDGRAACMQPEEQLSGYRVSDGISYYQVSRDASTDFFMDKCGKGSTPSNIRSTSTEAEFIRQELLPSSRLMHRSLADIVMAEH